MATYDTSAICYAQYADYITDIFYSLLELLLIERKVEEAVVILSCLGMTCLNERRAVVRLLMHLFEC